MKKSKTQMRFPAGPLVQPSRSARRRGWRPARGSRSRGAILVMVLVALVVASAVLASIVKLAAADRRAWLAEGRRIQADWLAASAIQRAAAKLHLDPEYPGETWLVPPEAFGERRGGKAAIQVTRIPDRPAERQVRVQADYPDDPHDRARRVRQAVLRIPQGEQVP